MPRPNHKGRSLLSREALAKIHMAKKALCLPEDDYRDLLERITGHRSSADMTPDQLPALQREFRRLGWDGWLLTREEFEGVAGPSQAEKYADCDGRPNRPNGAQLRMLEARFKNLKGYADIQPTAALMGFLEKRYGISSVRFLDDETYEAALTAIKRLETERGVKIPWKSRKTSTSGAKRRRNRR